MKSQLSLNRNLENKRRSEALDWLLKEAILDSRLLLGALDDL